MVEGLIRETSGQRADEIMQELLGTRHAIQVAGRPVLGQLVPLSCKQHWMDNEPPTVTIDGYRVMLQALTEGLRGRDPSSLVDFLSLREVTGQPMSEGTLEEVMIGSAPEHMREQRGGHARTYAHSLGKRMSQSTMLWRDVCGHMQRDWHPNFSAGDLTFRTQDIVFSTDTHLLAALLYSIWKHPQQLDETEKIDGFWTMARGPYAEAKAADGRAAVIVNNLESMAKRYNRKKPSCLVSDEYILPNGYSKGTYEVNYSAQKTLRTNALYALTLAVLGFEKKAKAVLDEIKFYFTYADGYGAEAYLPNGSLKQYLVQSMDTATLCWLGMAKAGVGDRAGATDIADMIERGSDGAFPVPRILYPRLTHHDLVDVERLGPTAAYALLLHVLGKRIEAFRRLETGFSLRRRTQPRPLNELEQFAMDVFEPGEDIFYRGELSVEERLLAAVTYADLARKESLFAVPR